MKKTLLLSALALGFTSQTMAGEHHAPQAKPWTLAHWNQVQADMPKGDVTRGADLHKNGLCMTCHGENGVAPSRNVPSLASNTPAYTYKMLMDYKHGLRNEGDGKSKVMQAAAHNMSEQDMADLAAFYAHQSLPAMTDLPMVTSEIDRLVRKGDVNRMITPCASCHGAHGEGHDEVPALAGQTPHYFVRTMQAYKNGLRKNDINDGMAQFTHDLTDAEIQALAEYYAGLGKK